MDKEHPQFPLHILLAVEDGKNTEAMRRVLESGKFDCRVTHQTEGAAVLAQVQQQPKAFDLLLAAQQLADMSGLELCLELRRKKIDLPLVILAESNSTKTAVQALKAGVNDYLVLDEKDEYLALLPETVLSTVIEYREQKNDRERQEAYHTLVEQALQGLAIMRDGRLLFVNPALGDLSGYSEAELHQLTADDLLDLVHREERRQLEKLLIRSEEGSDEPARGEFRLIRRDGSLLWLEGIARPIQYQGEQALQVSFLDITRRKEAEEALQRHTLDLQVQNQELDAFAHTVAHDLKNPLSTLSGMAEIMESDYGDTLNPQLRKGLNSISRSGRKAVNIVNELLLLASVRKEEIVPEPLAMGRIVAEAQTRLVDIINKHEAELIVPDIWPIAMGHAIWIEEVWVNYISNAIKYGGHPPRVELGHTEMEDGMIKFWVTDDGMGMTPQRRDEIFVSFSRLNQVRAKGHGLGLSIVQSIISKLNGRVGVESEVGWGSTFYFTLPAYQ